METPSTCLYVGQGGGGVVSVHPGTKGQGHWSSSTLAYFSLVVTGATVNAINLKSLVIHR